MCLSLSRIGFLKCTFLQLCQLSLWNSSVAFLSFPGCHPFRPRPAQLQQSGCKNHWLNDLKWSLPCFFSPEWCRPASCWTAVLWWLCKILRYRSNWLCKCCQVWFHIWNFSWHGGSDKLLVKTIKHVSQGIWNKSLVVSVSHSSMLIFTQLSFFIWRGGRKENFVHFR